MTGGVNRIVLVLQAPPESDATFEPVLRIARHSAARIEGVFVEDRRLLDIAAFPSARFVHTRSHETTTPDERIIRRAIRIASGRARQALSARVTASSIPWSFTSRQCASLSEAFGEATAGDLVIVPLLRNAGNIGQISDLIHAIRHSIAASLLVLNARGTPDRSILVLFDGDIGDLAAALDLAANFECPVSVRAVAEDAAAGDAFAATARDYLAQDGSHADIGTLLYRNADELADAVRAIAPGTLVIDRDGRTAKKFDMARLLATSPVSLYLRN